MTTASARKLWQEVAAPSDFGLTSLSPPLYDLSVQFGKRLRQLRKKKGLGLKPLAKIVRVNHAYLSRIEASHVRPSEQVIGRLAKALGHDEIGRASCRER